MNTIEDDNYDNSDDELVSKSQLKRDMHELQALGQELTELTTSQLKKIVLPESLSDAVHAARAINAHGARKRQLQYIGKLMRNIDSEPIRQQLDKLKNHSVANKKHFHQLELWRDKLIDGGDTAMSGLLQEHPNIDRQHLRQLIRSAQKEKTQDKPPRAARALFQYLRELTEQ